jgi:hypothetical protein
MITKDPAKQFAQEWIDAWNAHDLDRVLSHYTDDSEMSSSFIATIARQRHHLLQSRVGKTRNRSSFSQPRWQGLQGACALQQLRDLSVSTMSSAQ